MLVLFFTLILLILMILLGQLNPGLITINFFGLLIKNIPLSFFMLIFIIVGVLWASSIFGIKYFRLKKKMRNFSNGNNEEEVEDQNG